MSIGSYITAFYDSVQSAISYSIDHAMAEKMLLDDCMVITGFWRSGTTWLQQQLSSRLRAKSVFEPLDPRAIESNSSFAPYPFEIHEEKPFLYTYMPYASEDIKDKYPELFRYIKRALLSDVKGCWVRRARRSTYESFLLRNVVKLVRGQLCMRGIVGAFGLPLVHVSRDPRAIAASVQRGLWWRGWLDNLPLTRLTLQMNDGREQFFRNWEREIIMYDRSDPLMRLIAYWALTERYTRECKQDHPDKIALLRYENLVLNEDSLLQELRPIQVTLDEHTLGRSFPSPTTSRKRRDISLSSRVSGWKQELSLRQINSIEKVVMEFGLEESFFDA